MVIHTQVSWYNACYGNPLTGLLVLCMWWESTHRWGGAMHALVIHLRSVGAMHTCICNPHTGELVQWHVLVIHTRVICRFGEMACICDSHTGQLTQIDRYFSTADSTRRWVVTIYCRYSTSAVKSTHRSVGAIYCRYFTTTVESTHRWVVAIRCRYITTSVESTHRWVVATYCRCYQYCGFHKHMVEAK